MKTFLIIVSALLLSYSSVLPQVSLPKKFYELKRNDGNGNYNVSPGYHKEDRFYSTYLDGNVYTVTREITATTSKKETPELRTNNLKQKRPNNSTKRSWIGCDVNLKREPPRVNLE